MQQRFLQGFGLKLGRRSHPKTPLTNGWLRVYEMQPDRLAGGSRRVYRLGPRIPAAEPDHDGIPDEWELEMGWTHRISPPGLRIWIVMGLPTLRRICTRCSIENANG
ncbi:MAG: hypothetical protein A2Z14_12535 [Chloroflexi bacterium RBG_16_48_8]|nr:MAG: hypothetical protein A2Z14_12535 [Chloroflexi bacterium RBG_16_48_8]